MFLDFYYQKLLFYDFVQIDSVLYETSLSTYTFYLDY